MVCPVSIVGQWANEVKSKLAANLSIYMYHGSKRYTQLVSLWIPHSQLLSFLVTTLRGFCIIH